MMGSRLVTIVQGMSRSWYISWRNRV